MNITKTTIIIFISLLALVLVNEMNVFKRLNYAIDYELGIAHLCDGTDTAYEVHNCKYDYSDLLN